MSDYYTILYIPMAIAGACKRWGEIKHFYTEHEEWFQETLGIFDDGFDDAPLFDCEMGDVFCDFQIVLPFLKAASGFPIIW